MARLPRAIASGLALRVAFGAALAGATACRSQADVASEPAPASSGASDGASGGASRVKPGVTASAAPAALPVRVIEAPASGDVAAIVKAAVGAASPEHRTVVVYVGAAWCEPCQRFHAAAARGDLDADFPGLTLVAFDLDRDRDRLSAAGYVSRLIPLFALPGPGGAASGKQIEGGIKGEGAVGFIAPRLKDMLSE